MAISFSHHRLKKTLSNYLLGSRVSFSNYGASNKIISLRPKESNEAVFFQLKASVLVKKRLWTIFSHITRLRQTPETLS